MLSQKATLHCHLDYRCWVCGLYILLILWRKRIPFYILVILFQILFCQIPVVLWERVASLAETPRSNCSSSTLALLEGEETLEHVLQGLSHVALEPSCPLCSSHVLTLCSRGQEPQQSVPLCVPSACNLMST